jgi:signal transduction histidine kinase
LVSRRLVDRFREKARDTKGIIVEFLETDLPPTLSSSRDVTPSGYFEVERSYLRLEIEGNRADIQNLNELLRGAPPLQISKLSSSLSHELRNPLSSVKMAVQTLARHAGLAERDQRRLVIAQREIRTIERMLWMLSEYGRDTAPRLELMPLRALLQQSIEMIDRELRDRQTQVTVIEPEPTKVLVDPTRLRPVLAQLLWNVVIGHEPGGQVEVHLGIGPLGPTLEVTDTASTLVPEEEATLFEPFGSRLARGAGLSLAALKRAMRLQGGEVTASVGNPSGTVFRLTFPSV